MSLILILLLALLSTAVTGFLAASAPLVRLTPYALESDAWAGWIQNSWQP